MAKAAYIHKDINGKTIGLPAGKVLCVGRNYAAHARELGNSVPDSPVLFMKPKSSMVCLEPEIYLPVGQGECHYETELALLIGEDIHCGESNTAKDVENKILAYGLALDLTLRDLQQDLKQKGLPWERAKAFDGSCPLTAFVNKEGLEQEPLIFQTRINNKLVQEGFSKDMLFPIIDLIVYMSRFFSIQAGDVILTGTPSGVGPLSIGDKVELSLMGEFEFSTRVC